MNGRSITKKFALQIKTWLGLKDNHLLNCWFCNEDCEIKLLKDEVGWTCTYCQQYNGFNEDGDYDQPIAEQHETPEKSKSSCRQGSFEVANSVLCYSCNQNQVMKVAQLASFIPLSESSYDGEVEGYQDFLEHVYRLCQQCRDKVGLYLDKQDEKILRQLDKENLQIQDHRNNDDGSRLNIISGTAFIKSWSTPLLFCLCFLMAAINFLFNLKLYFELQKESLSRLFPVDLYPYLQCVFEDNLVLPADSVTLQLPVYFGTWFCVLGLLTVGKTCLYVEDVFHIVSWLVLLVSNALAANSAAGIFFALGGYSPVYLVFSLATAFLCLMCLRQSRLPRNIVASNANAQISTSEQKEIVPRQSVVEDENTSTNELSPKSGRMSSLSSPFLSSPSSVSRSPSPTPSNVGEAYNFFKPISQSQTSSPLSFLSASPGLFEAQDKSQNTFETVRSNLESFSFGIGNKSGSTSNMWSLPSIIASEPQPIPDSTVRTSPSMAGLRDVLSPSRLSFISFSGSPSPGKFSSSPTNEIDSGVVPDYNQYRDSEQDSQSRFAKKSFQYQEARPTSTTSFLSLQQKQGKDRPDAKSFSAISNKQKVAELSMKKVVAVPDSSTPNGKGENVRPPGPRRSDRIAMRGNIIRPWPLKKSLSVNDMYDRSLDIDFIKRSKGDKQILPQDENEKEESGFHRYEPSTLGKQDSPQYSSLDKDSSHHGRRKGKFMKGMERIEEFSDDEESDSPWRKRGKKVMQGESTNSDSQWLWTLLGLVIGISVTINAFLVWNMWRQSTDITRS